MTLKRGALLAIPLLVALSASTFAAPLRVVTTTTYFADIVRRIGGDSVEVLSIAPPKFNIHFIQPRPSDVRNAARADLFVHAGLDLEAWVDPLLEAAGKPELFKNGPRNLDLSRGIRLLKVPLGTPSRSEGDLHLFGNPHYTLNPENAGIAADSIAAKLSAILPEGAAAYEERRQKFRRELESKIGEWKALCAPCAWKEIFSFHDDIAYLADFTGLKAVEFLEPKPGVPPTPKHLMFLESYAQQRGVRVIAIASYYERGSAEAFAKRIGGTVVTVAQNPGEIPGTEDVFKYYETNIRALADALKQRS